ncbi:MAG: hypothetical protein K0S21_3299 [Rhizobiaceae bacterium]|nr:hypothetical protein [Rhizobiaceae bacterium]
MRQHGPLRASRGAGRVKDGGEVFAAAIDIGEPLIYPGRLLRKGAAAVLVERFEPCAMRSSNLAHAGLGAGRTDDQPRLRVTDEVIQFGQRVGGVQRQIDSARAQAGEIEHQCFDALFDLDGDSVARLHAGSREHDGDAAREVEHVEVGPDMPIGGFDEGRLRRCDRRANRVEHMIAHDVSSLSSPVPSMCRPGSDDPRRAGRSLRNRRLTAADATTSPRSMNASWFASMSSSL